MTAPLLATEQHDEAVTVKPVNAPAAEETADQTAATQAQAADATPAPVEPDVAAAPADEPAAVNEPAAADELPAPAARDAIHLFAQSPVQLFLHWSHAADPFDALREAFADAAARYRLAVRLTDLGDATEQLFHASPERAQWLDARPGREYRADLGFHADGLPFVRLLSSAAVRTPRAAVSPEADAAPQFHITPADFSRLLENIGYPPESPARHAPRGTHDATTHASYCHFSSGQWEVQSSKLKARS